MFKKRSIALCALALTVMSVFAVTGTYAGLGPVISGLSPGETVYIVTEIPISYGFDVNAWFSLTNVECSENGVVDPEQDWYDLYGVRNDIDSVITFGLWLDRDGDTSTCSASDIWVIEEDCHVSDIKGEAISLGIIPKRSSIVVVSSYHMDGETENWAQSDTMTFDIELTRTQVTPEPGPPHIPGRPNAKPKADAGPNQKSWTNMIVYFSGSKSEDPDGTIESYEWDFGDGTTASIVAPEHIYSEPGQYTVTLTVRDNRWAYDSDTCKVKVSDTPTEVSAEFAERVPGEKKGHVVDAFEEVNTTVTLNTTEPVTVTVLKYEDNPYPEDPIPASALPTYVDVEVGDPDAVVWPIYVEIFYTDEEVEGIDEYSLGIYYWMDGAWRKCSDTGVDTERNVVWAYMTAVEASGSPILMGGMPGIIVPPLPPFLSDLTITPEEIEIGDNVTIGLDIMNPNDRSITYIVTMKIGELTLLVDVELEAYESKTVSHTITPDTVGDFNVTVNGLTGSFEVKALPEPEFEVSDLRITPGEVELGDELTVSFVITNADSRSYVFVPFVQIGDTGIMDGVELEGHKSRTVSHTITPESVGDYEVEVDRLTGSFTVNPIVPIWMRPGTIAGMLIVVVSAGAIIYTLRRRQVVTE